MGQLTDVSRVDADGLFARAREGDQEAWDELFRTCQEKLLRVIRRKLDPPLRSLYDSADFASDVWKSLAAKCDRFDFPSVESLMAFLAQAARQKVIDAYRKQQALKRGEGQVRPMDWADGAGTEPPALDPTPSQVVVAEEGWQQVWEQLSPTEQTVLLLKRQGYSTEEIVARTGWHKRKIQRFLQELRQSWPGEGGRE